ncbi:FYVE zinc finger-domain-containing protein [Chlamydoabsidia padenii]|nr:FYVE zinc finger-domain-containing protein [Chlamydoabsidia padenii]
MSYNYEDYVPVEGAVCPICQQSCPSIQSLNLHLDTAHSEEDTKGALLTWFKQAQKKVQTTLTVNNSNNGTGRSTSPTFFKTLNEPSFISQFQQLATQSQPDYFVCETERYSDMVVRSHWQHETGQDVCSLRGCGKVLGRGNTGKQHCRRCGKLFCNAHTQYEIKLNHQAQHDPIQGVWAKVCGTCYMDREDYANHQGVMRNISAAFLSKRAKTIDQVYLETNRLEKRLEKLARLHFNMDLGKGLTEKPISQSSFASLERSDSASSSNVSVNSGTLSPRNSNGSNTNSILSMKLKYRDGEQSIIKWQDDKGIKKCPLCSTPFTLTYRKHHCRLCGRVVCGAKHCSSMIPLYLDMSTDNIETEPVGDTRACHECRRAGFRRKIRSEESSRPLPIFQLYHQLTVARQNIEKLLPKFHSMILMLEQEKIVQQTHESYRKAALIRKSLLDNFALYDTLVKSIKSLPAQTGPMKRLQANICTAANQYLQRNMLPLQMLPRILNTNTQEKKKKKTNNNNNKQQDELVLQLDTFREQVSLVQGFIMDAKRNRKYDDVKTLTTSLNELELEIDRLSKQLNG